MRCQAVLFDLGNTLVAYWGRAEWPAVLAEATREVTEHLRAGAMLKVNEDELPRRVEAERGERDDLRVRPLAGRLARIFDLKEVDLEACRAFMKPLFARARVYDDVLPTLAEKRGMKIQVVVHEAEEGGYWAEVPAIPECATQGETFEELLSNFYEAVEGCLSVS